MRGASRNYIPKFQAEFGVAEEEADGTKVGLPSGAVSIPLPLKYPTPYREDTGGGVLVTVDS